MKPFRIPESVPLSDALLSYHAAIWIFEHGAMPTHQLMADILGLTEAQQGTVKELIYPYESKMYPLNPKERAAILTDLVEGAKDLLNSDPDIDAKRGLKLLQELHIPRLKNEST